MLKLIAAALLLLLSAGCSNFAYYAQAVEGQFSLMAARRPVADILTDATTDPGLRRQLAQAGTIREFASRELALPDNDSYRTYADLRRPYVVWNVFGAPEFSVELQRWCLVWVGCVNYRGYYDRKEAERYADTLHQAGADTYVGGVAAYSTLGYFDDPLLNTFLRFGDQEVARTLFHELAHQVVFAPDDTVFNESFATTVENEGMRRWLIRSAMPEQLQDIEMRQQRRMQFMRLLAEGREKLRTIYAEPLTPEQKRLAKSAVIEEMKRTYADLKAGWGGWDGYDPWFSLPLNNATLGSVALYTKWVPAFHALLEQENGNLPRFYGRVAALARLSKAERSARLEQLLASDKGASAWPS